MAYPNFISKIFSIYMNITLHVKNSYNANSDLDVDILIGGKTYYSLNFLNMDNSNERIVREKQSYNNLKKDECILFVSNFHLTEEDKPTKQFSKIDTLYNKEFNSTDFGFVNHECIWSTFFNFEEYKLSISSCIPIIDFFALYTKGSSLEPELVFDKFNISISIRLNQNFEKICMTHCNDLIKFLKKFDVSYMMPIGNQIILNEKVMQKFTRDKKSFIMNSPMIGDINNLIFNCNE
ncbi:Hypothetical protein SRAE_2000387500 [Strongyloides ratti]|uniref:Uncharacterized protein n=1 Tax=Strongyloides ratti TaxID=34506 RepID=A0A090LNZ8_STRRB|nr:Hypothetical protein SRAE_2000387500 [Strongyloides ratti]CEF69225.1 Hypothetical protein SRAE_2000387500 [Strongyloides ratti]